MRYASAAAFFRRWTALLLSLSLLIPATADAEAVRVGGTGSGSVLMQRLAQAYQQSHPGNEVIVIMPPLSSGGGVRALSAGKIDLAVVGRPLKAEEAAMPTLGQAFEYVKTPLVFASSMAEKPALTHKQLVDIYAGRLVKWPDGSPIRLVLRSKSESDTLVMRSMSRDMSAAIDASYERPGMVTADNDIDTVNLLVKTPGSLGPTTLGLLRLDGRNLNVLRLDGVDASVGTMASGRYPWVKSMHLVAAAAPAAEVLNFLAFLHSDEARRLLDEADFALVSKWTATARAK